MGETGTPEGFPHEMHFDMHPFAILSTVSALISLLTWIVAWKRSVTGSLSLSLLLASLFLWSGLYSIQWMNISLGQKTFWFNAMYIATVAVPTLFLVFVIEFTGNAGWLTGHRLRLLSIHPIASLLLVWTNSYHHIFYFSITPLQENSLITLEFVRGPWYFANVAYSYMIITAALLLLGLGLARSGPMYRQQYGLIFLGSLIPCVSSLYSEYHFDQLHGVYLTPITFGLSGTIFVLAILRTHFLDLIPVARSYVIESMRDGIVVLDTHNRIVDINPAMESFLENKLSFYMGKNASEFFSSWASDPEFLGGEMESRVELRLPLDPSRYLDLRVTPLYDRNQSLNGRLMVFRDITERKQVEKRLRYVNDRLQSQLIEIGLLQSKLREQAIRDPLTNLFNRRYLEETLDRELARASREAYSVCLLMIDLDHFKRINDSHGHEAGDHVLRAHADTLSRECRRGDFACRHGGEEFVVVMPNISVDTAYERAEALHNILNSLKIPYGDCSLSVTISMGIACYPANGLTSDAILRAADQAMYAAKEAGRNHILSYDQFRVSQEALDE
jgi:diguanylate cyclase (GGDEF)-like protein